MGDATVSLQVSKPVPACRNAKGSIIVRSLFGMVLLLGLAWLVSRDRAAIRLRVVLPALLLQVGLGALMLYVPIGRAVLAGLADGVNRVLDFGQQGARFLFGPLAGPEMVKLFGPSGFVFALHVLPTIVFVTALIAVLYHVGAMRVLIRGLGWALHRLLRVSRLEASAAVTTIFLGQSELPPLLQPFVAGLNPAALFAVMCSGMASTAGSVLAGYAGLGIPMPDLLAASAMAIPGGLLFAKLLLPGAGQQTAGFDVRSIEGERAGSVIEAAAAGAGIGLRVALNVGAMLMAFVGLIALLDGMLGGIGAWLGHPGLSLPQLLGPLFAPLAWLLGVPWADAGLAGHWIAEKTVLNEFVAYADFSRYLHSGPELAASGLPALQPATRTIVTFALCGFANFGSIAILIGGFSAVCPQRRAEVARFGLLALLAATFSNLMSAAIAGLFLALRG